MCTVEIKEAHENKGSLLIFLSGELTRREVRSVRDRLLREMRSVTDLKHVAVDISKLDRIDTAGVALLVLLCRHVNALKATFRLCNPGDKVRRVFKLAQIEEFLNVENGNDGA